MKKILICIAALSLAACGGDNDPNRTPVAPQSSDMFSGALLGGLAGYMMGRSSTPSAQLAAPAAAPVPARTTVINNHYHQQGIPPAPAVKVTPAPVPAPVPAAASKPSYSGPSSYSSSRTSVSSGRR